MRLIDADGLIAEYDRVHVGPPGRARELIINAKTVQPEETTATAIRAQDGDVMWYICDACNEPINLKDRFCGSYGRKVRWNERQYQVNHGG